MTFGLFAHTRPAVPADIIESAHLASRVPQDDDVFLIGIQQKVIPAIRDAADVPGAEPALQEDAFGLCREHLGRDVIFTSQSLRTAQISLFRFVKSNHGSLQCWKGEQIIQAHYFFNIPSTARAAFLPLAPLTPPPPCTPEPARYSPSMGVL